MHRGELKGFGVFHMLLLVLAVALPVWAGAGVGSQQLPAGVSGDWWTQAQAYIRQAEYHPSPVSDAAAPAQPAAVQVVNRAHNLRATFTPEGVRVKPRTATSADWSWGLSLEAIGAPGDLRRPEPARLQLNGQRVELVRGPLTEWYRNDERGLEQGFTLHQPPPGGAGAAELVLRLAVQGSLVGSISSDTNLSFVNRDGKPMLHFGHLLALDATGRELPARFGLTEGSLEITVATAAARYPLLIDPLATSPNWTAESDQAGAQSGVGLGYSVGTAGDVNGDDYADVIVGAPIYDNGQAYEGRAFVFHGSASGLSPTPNWTAESDKAQAWFGYSVGTAGDVNGDGFTDVIVGAPHYDNGQFNTEEGRAYVFHGSASGLSPTPNWTDLGDQLGTNFGSAVGTAGDVNGDGFADVIVGAQAQGYDNGQTDKGRAFVFHGSASGLKPYPNWTAESDQAYAWFGESVGTAGDVNGDGFADVIVGAPYYDNGQTKEGRAFVFHGSASGLSPTPNWTAESDQAYAWFGYSVGTAGDVNGDGFADVIIGASLYSNSQQDEGRAFVYHGSASGLSPTPKWTAESDEIYARFGESVGTAGDVNGDGFADVIVGALHYDNDQAGEGRAFVFHGSASGLSPTPSWTAESDQGWAQFGSSVATAGDVNGDGFADVIIGAPAYDNGQTDEGRVFVYHGSGSAAGAFYVIPRPSGQATIIYLE